MRTGACNKQHQLSSLTISYKGQSVYSYHIYFYVERHW